MRRKRKNLSGMAFLVDEFTEEFTMGSSNAFSAVSISNCYPQNAAAQNAFHFTQFNEPPIHDTGIAAEISRHPKSQTLYRANTSVYAQAIALTRPICPL